MSLSNAKNYVVVVLAGLVFIAGALLIILQWGNVADFSLYGKIIYDFNLALLMALTAVGGVVLWYAAKLFLGSAFGIWRERRRQAKYEQKAQKKVAQSSAASSTPSAPSEPASDQSS